MKRPPPSPPFDAPPGTVTLGGPLGWFSAALHVTSENLAPDAITLLFSAEPTACQTKGVPILREDGTSRHIPQFGRWTTKMKSSQTDEWDINEVITELLARLPESLEIWHQVARLGCIRISLGLAMVRSNEDFVLEPELLRYLGERQVQIYFDIYREDEAVP